MKTLISVLLASALMAVAKPFGPIEPSDSPLVLPDIAIPEDPITYYAGLRDALSDLHEKGIAVKGYLQTVCKLSNEDAVLALKYLIDNLAGCESFRDKDDRFQAICCIRDYPCDEAYALLEHLLADENEPERRAAAYSLTRMSLGDSARLARLQAIVGTIPTENWARQEVYQTIATHLQYAGPLSSNQISLVRFLLNRTIVDAQLFDMLDEILCREVPKWRASPQRAENAAKMIREHPDDAGPTFSSTSRKRNLGFPRQDGSRRSECNRRKGAKQRSPVFLRQETSNANRRERTGSGHLLPSRPISAGFGYGRMTSVAGAVLARREGSYMASAWAGGRTKVPAETACAT